MLTLISPAKSLDLERTAKTPRATQPRLLDESARLVKVMRRCNAQRLAKLMKISPALAELNVERFRAWKTPFDATNARRAILMFDGDVYTGLGRDDYSREDWAFAQNHVRILSGLYGVLRPLDLIQPYRLEMGTRIDVNGHRGLYEFWGDRLTKVVRRDLARHADRTVVNLASDEYFKSIRPADLPGSVIKPLFKEERDGVWKVISFSAKRARGLMTDYIIRNRIDTADAIRAFDIEGYRYDARKSTAWEWFFGREAR